MIDLSYAMDMVAPISLKSNPRIKWIKWEAVLQRNTLVGAHRGPADIRKQVCDVGRGMELNPDSAYYYNYISIKDS